MGVKLNHFQQAISLTLFIHCIIIFSFYYTFKEIRVSFKPQLIFLGAILPQIDTADNAAHKSVAAYLMLTNTDIDQNSPKGYLSPFSHLHNNKPLASDVIKEKKKQTKSTFDLPSLNDENHHGPLGIELEDYQYQPLRFRR